jgi:hypothetical protein
LRAQQIDSLKKKGTKMLVLRNSMHDVNANCSPLMNQDNCNLGDKPLSPGDSYHKHYNNQVLSSTDIFNDGFYYNEKGSLMCDNYEVATIANHMVQPSSPFYLMSRG